jgi:mannose-6-phosphate isomerase-like protein (cupin superfamily)
MKTFYITLLLLIVSQRVLSQSRDLTKPFTDPATAYDQNLHIEKLFGDSLCNSSLLSIWDVKLHKHVSHSEHVYIVEGEGTMTLGDSTLILKPGLLIFIPKGTPHSAKSKRNHKLKVLSIYSPAFDGKDRIFLEK